MPINNINTLVSKEILEYLNNGQAHEWILKYYNEALANLGQRNTENRQIDYVSFSINSIISDALKMHNQNYDSEAVQSYLHQNNYIELYNYHDTQNGSDLSNVKDKIKFRLSNGIILDLFSEEYDSPNNDIIVLQSQINIIVELFKKIISELENDENQNNWQNSYVLNVPVDYEFEYICDTINKINMYGSNKDICVTFVPTYDDGGIYEASIRDNKIIYININNTTSVKTNAYDYRFEYNDNLLNFRQITIGNKFTYPYIDDNNYWIINNVNTYIPAKSKDALNLNIILVYQENDNLIPLSGFNKNLYQSFTINTQDCYVKRPNSDSGKSVFKIKVQLPQLKIADGLDDMHLDMSDVDNITTQYSNYVTNRILANSTLIHVGKVVECLDTTGLTESEISDIYSDYGDGYITTIWNYHLEELDNNQYNFWEYVSTDIDNYGHPIALDFSALTNFNNLLKSSLSRLNQIKPDNFLFRHLIFESAVKDIKQSTDTNQYYPILKNFIGSEYQNVNKKYSNNLNFGIRYASKIGDNPGSSINSIQYNGNNNYFKISTTGEDYDFVTNSIYSITSYGEDNSTKLFNEYVPNYNVPTLDLSEIFVKDFNVMNRQNILSFADNGKVYYSYFGSSSNNYEKNVLHIGTSNLNINIGQTTLASANQKSSFQTVDTLDIDIQNINFNANNVYSNGLTTFAKDINKYGISWDIMKLGDTTIYSTTIIPKYKYNYANSVLYNIVELENINYGITNLPLNDDDSGVYLYTNVVLKKKENNINYYYKQGDLLCLKNLLNYLGITNPNVIFDSETSDIITINNKQVYLSTMNNKLNDLITISVTNVGTQINVDSTTNVFFGDPLDIIYKVSSNGQGTLTINEKVQNKILSIWRIPTTI